MPDAPSTKPDSRFKSHLVAGLSEVVVHCGGCRDIWNQPIDPRERLSHLVCPHCNTALPTDILWNLTDQYERRDDAA